MAQRKVKSISIPPELSTRLEAFPEENWSAVAAEAFERRVTTLERMSSGDEEERAVARLQASKRASTARRNDEGSEAGIRYVLETASYPELEGLREWARRYREAEKAAITEDSMDRLPPRPNSFLDVATILTGPGPRAKQLDAQLRERFGDDIDSSEWISAFINGALTKFQKLDLQMIDLSSGPFF